MLGRERAENAAGQCGVERGWSSLAADITDCQRGAASAVVEVVVDVAPDGSGGDELGGDLGALEFGGTRRHEAELDLASHFEVALHALFLFVDALVEAGVGDTDGDLRGESRERALMVFV